MWETLEIRYILYMKGKYNVPFHIDYRPAKLNEFIGNGEIIRDLQAKFPHWPQTILISAPSGCGKTTLARIISHELKCAPMYMKEIDAAQDRGIDAIRTIIKESYSRPLMGAVKVIIFDECHMLTPEAMNALLKISEEPPPKTYFIFCSTAPEKILPTLRNRCFKIKLSNLSDREISLIIKNVADKEVIKFTEPLKQICRFILSEAKGVPREALLLFESLKDCTNLEEAQTKIHGFTDNDPKIYNLVQNLITKNYDKIIETFQLLPQTNFESCRIVIAKIIYKFILREKNIEKRDYLFSIYSHFIKPVDNQIGNIELLYRFWELSKK